MRFKPENIREGRGIKKEAVKAGVHILGRQGKKFEEEVIPQLEKLIEKSVEDNKEWLEKEWQKINEKLAQGDEKIPFEKFVQVFQSTLEKRIRVLGRFKNIPYGDVISGNNSLENIFDQAVFDFIMSLRKSLLRGDTLKQALFLADLSHWIDPTTIERLNKKYGDRADFSVIKSAAMSYPRAPDAFLDSYVQTVDRLTKKYGDRVDVRVVRVAAISYPKNPDAFIDSYIEAFDRLSKKYGDTVDLSLIKKAATSFPGNPDDFIDKYVKALKRLEEKYKGKVEGRVITTAAGSYSNGPDAFIDSYIEAVNRLTKKYEGKIDPNVISTAALSHPTDPDTFIESYLVALGRLSQKYKDEELTLIIKIAAVSHPTDPDAFIDWFIKARNYLMSKNPNFTAGQVRNLLLNNNFKTFKELEGLL